MDLVYIQALETEAVIGVYGWEREIRQRLVLDLELGTDIRVAAANDDIDAALNYKSISDRVLELVRESEFFLLETLAEEIAACLMSEFGVQWLRLKLAKPGAVPEAADVGVIIERGEMF